MRTLFGFFLAALSATGFAATFVFGAALTKAWILVGGLGLFSTLMPFWTWNAAQKYMRTSTLAMTAYFTPVIAMGMGIAFLGEGATGLQCLGTAFIVGSAVVERTK